MLKVKHERTADCVVAGFRQHKDGGGVGSLLLGLYDEGGALNHVGVASGFCGGVAQEPRGRPRSVPHGRPRRTPVGRRGWPRPTTARASLARRAAGTPRRTSPGSRCVPSSCARSVTTICRATVSATPTSFRRWRPDRQPASCTYAQLEAAVPEELARVFGAGA